MPSNEIKKSEIEIILERVSKKIKTNLGNEPLLIISYISFDLQHTKDLRMDIYPEKSEGNFSSYYQEKYGRIIEEITNDFEKDIGKVEKIKFHNVALKSGWDYLGIKFRNHDISIVFKNNLESEDNGVQTEENLETAKNHLVVENVLEVDEASKFSSYITKHFDFLKDAFKEKKIETSEIDYFFFPFKCAGDLASAVSFFIKGNDAGTGNVEKLDHLRKEIFFDTSSFATKQYMERIRSKNIKIAIITILVDSYAHNISAHSLSYLEWWFRLRGSELGEKWAIDHVMWRFLKYLQCKAAFWSGVTRDKTFGGEIKNLYSVLWEDFANNPLFLGTIAASEGIFKVGIYIKLKNSDGSTIFEGEFFEIDLSILRQEEEKKSHEDLKDGSIYNFVRLEKDFQKIKEKLVKLNVFFPGGVVGEHAFFTILENTLRNVKHIDKDDLKDIANDRLQLYISIMDCGKIIKVGIWLNHPVKLINKAEAVIFRLKDMLESQIIDDKGSPILGGTSQDKICASMLYNNTFQLVEENSKERYPWIKVAS